MVRASKASVYARLVSMGLAARSVQVSVLSQPKRAVYMERAKTVNVFARRDTLALVATKRDAQVIAL